LSNIEKNCDKNRVHQVSPTTIRTFFLNHIHHPMDNIPEDAVIKVVGDKGVVTVTFTISSK
jgi:hypothetical protein